MNDSDNLPEKDKLNIYENDEAYMLYDDKQNQEHDDEEQLLEDDMDLNLNSDNDNAIYDFEGDHEHHQGNLIEGAHLEGEEDGTRRKTDIEIDQLNDDYDPNENYEHLETSKKNEGKILSLT